MSDRFTWSVTLAAIVAYALLAFFFWQVVDVVTPFLVILPVGAVGLLVIGAAAVGLVHLRRRYAVKRWRAALPLAVLVTSVAVFQLVDFTALWLRMNFALHRAERERVVRSIVDGSLQPEPDSFGLVTLPPEVQSTSMGGTVDVQEDGRGVKILFFTYRGVPDSFAGFVYSASGEAPRETDFGGTLQVIEPRGGRWFYVSGT